MSRFEGNLENREGLKNQDNLSEGPGEVRRQSRERLPVSDGFTIALVGQPNVGKSVIMNLLTGTGAVVSNYPGTTVEVTQAVMTLSAGKFRVIDTPGTYSLHSDTEEQRVTQRVLLEENIDLIINVVDARALDRNLYLTLQLLDLETPMIVVLNQMDMVAELGIEIKTKELGDILGVPVIPMVASRGIGLKALQDQIISSLGKTTGNPMTFSPSLEKVIGYLVDTIESMVPEVKGRHRLHPARALAIHLMEHDKVDEDLYQMYPRLREAVEDIRTRISEGEIQCANCLGGCAFCPIAQESHPVFRTCLERSLRAKEIALKVSVEVERSSRPQGLRERVEAVLDRPSTGIPILVAISLLSYYFATFFMKLAEELVDFCFSPIAAWFKTLAGRLPAGSLVHALLLSIPEGLILPFSVVMPAMVSIYLIMSILEDTGLLPRISVALDRFMSVLGLPGQAVLPLLLGFGCRAPAVLATRVLPDDQSRVVVSTMLAIVVPCAASLGIITGVGAAFGANLGVVYISMAFTFLAIGLIVSRILWRYSEGKPKRGPVGSARENPAYAAEKDAEPLNGGLIMEIPPLRWPVISNIWAKSKMRLSGFFSHVLPLLVITSVLVRLLLDSGVLSFLSGINKFSTLLFGIRGQALLAVAVTVVQRYMAPMVLLNLPLTAREATIAAAMVSLSMPCLPVSILIGKEFGWRTLGKIMALALMISATVGIVLNIVLP